MRQLRLPGIISILIFLLISSYVSARSLEEIKRSGKIYVALTSDDFNNINYDLALEFARYLNVELIEVEIDWNEAFMHNGIIPEGMRTDSSLSYTPDALKKADIICSTFTMLEWRKKLFGFARTLESAELLMVGKDAEIPKSFQELAGKRIAFVGETSFETHLKEISASIDGTIDLRRTGSSEETKDLIEKREVDAFVMDADEALNFNVEKGQKYAIAFPISEVSRMAWAVEKNNPLIQEVENFFETIASNRILDEFFYRRFGITYSAYQELLGKKLRLERYQRDLDEILATKKIVVALRERDFIYREGGQKQFMHALAEEFADHLGVNLEFIVTPSFSKYWQTADGRIVRDSSYTPEWFNYFDLACETIAPLDWRTNKVNLVPVYPSAYVVVARKDTPIESLDDLKELKGVTGKETIYEDILRQNGIDNYYHENVNQFVADVVSGKADYTIIYDAFYALSEYPALEAKLELGQLQVSWALRKDQPQLQEALEAFIEGSRENGLIAVLLKALRGQTLQAPEAFIHSYYESFQTGQLPYVNYGASDGLPQEDILAIFQDRKGYIWFGTNSGAVRYNGREMEVFSQEDDLPDKSVRDIQQDSSGILYFACASGIGRYHDGEFLSPLLEGKAFKQIYIQSDGSKIYLGDEGLYRESDDGEIQHLNSRFPELPASIYQVIEHPESGDIFLATILGVFLCNADFTSLEQLTYSDSYSLFIDANDSIWISTRDGLFLSHINQLTGLDTGTQPVDLNARLNIPRQVVSAISTNKFGSVWLVTDARIYQVNSTDEEPIVYEQEIGIKNNKILSFLIDQEDNIWIGFSGGLQRLTNRRGLRNFYPGTIDSYIYSVFQDRFERIWITSDNGIFYFRDGQLNPFRIPDMPGDLKFSGGVLPGGNILLACNQGLVEVDSRTLRIIRKNTYPTLAHSPENLFVSSQGEIFLLTGINGTLYYFKDFASAPSTLKNKYTANIFQLTEYEGRIIGGNSLGFVVFEEGSFSLLEATPCNIWSLHHQEEVLWVGTDCGIGIVKNGRFEQMELQALNHDLVIKSILPARNRNYLWLGTNKGFSYYHTGQREFEFTINTQDGLSGDEITPGGLFLDMKDLLWIGTYHGISNFNIRAKTRLSYPPVCYMERMYLNGREYPAVNGERFAHNENNFEFEISALSFSDEASVEYEYYLRGLGNKYSSYHRGPEFRAHYNNLPPGKYEFIYKARGKNKLWGYAEKFEFSIRKAWYTTWIFRISLVTLIIATSYLFYRVRVSSIEAQKRKLEEQVRFRTHELEVANTEIEAQRDFARLQRDQIAQQQKAIVDSIQYAQTIQNSLLPSRQILEKMLPEHFILFKPRDIVSGDFYWVYESQSHIYITVADCTGHGVPGAFMSMLGMSLLNEIMGKYPELEPDELLMKLRERIIETLHQQSDPNSAKDGMDMVLLKINKDRSRLTFAGANNPLYLLRDGEIREYKGDKMPVAIHVRMQDFGLHELDIKAGDAIYIFSDGYADQFGGPMGKKLKYKVLKEQIMATGVGGMQEQGEQLEAYFNSWMGDLEQIDDVVLLGLKF